MVLPGTVTPAGQERFQGRVSASVAGLADPGAYRTRDGLLPGAPVNGQVCGCCLAFLAFVIGDLTGARFLPRYGGFNVI